MAASDSSPATPADCSHPAPTEGVMAREFSHYQGAVGPEGLRRTTTFYGPVIGGLPIAAWHCELCGLLKLSYPDGRREERRLYPGPQPDLLVAATERDPDVELYGMQARVSGLSASAQLLASLNPRGAAASRPRVRLPRWDMLTWVRVLLLLATAGGLATLAVLAVYTYTTPDSVGLVALVTVGCFASFIGLSVLDAVLRALGPPMPLAPSVTQTHRLAPRLTAYTAVAVGLLVVTAIGILTAGILAVYTYSTPDIESGFVIASLGAFVAALVLLIAEAAPAKFRYLYAVVGLLAAAVAIALATQTNPAVNVSVAVVASAAALAALWPAVASARALSAPA